MKVLIVSDLHFSSRSQDEYFFDLFDKVDMLIDEHKIDAVFVLGDLTTAKDNHSSKLVNRVTEGLVQWSKKVPVKVLMGNHDLQTAGNPFFMYVGLYPRIEFIATPKVDDDFLFLPFSKDLDADLDTYDVTGKIVFAHVSVEGSVYESGVKAEGGIDPARFDKAKIAFSGDIHSPQEVGSVIYVGCPYNIRMNDVFQGNCVILDTKTLEWKRIPMDFPKRRTLNISSVANLKVQLEDLRPRDQVKIRLHLDQQNMGLWRQIKDESMSLLKESGIVLSAFETPRDKLAPVALSKTSEVRFSDYDSYTAAQSISPELKQVGAEIIAEVSAR
jgi:hypothetical protein